MAKVNLSLSTKVDKELKKSEILIRFVYANGTAIRAKSGIYIPDKRWNAEKSEIIMPRIETDEQKELTKTNEQLDKLSNKIANAYLEADKSTISKEWLLEIIDRFHHPKKYDDKPQAFFDALTEFLGVRELSDVRRRNFMVVYRALQRYERYKGITLALDNFGLSTLQDFESFLRKEHTFFERTDSGKYVCKPSYRKIFEAVPESRTPQPRGQNTINDVHTKLRTFFLWSVERGKTKNNPYKEFSIKECVYGSPIYISIDERNQLYQTDLSARPQLAIQRDIFVFQCLIGCRVGDLYRFTKKNVINGAIEYIPRKTKDGRPITVSVPLNSIAKEILAKYEYYDGAGLLPFISEQKYNVAIKNAFKEAGLTRMVTVRNPTTGDAEIKPLNEIASSHLARRCFVGNLYKQVKDPNLVGALSGHKEGSKAFARYRKIDDEMKQDLVKLLE